MVARVRAVYPAEWNPPVGVQGMMRTTNHSLSPQRGEGRGEGCDRSHAALSTHALDSSPRPSPRSKRRGSAGRSFVPARAVHLLIFSLFLGTAGLSAAAPPDLILHHGKIVTVDSNFSIHPAMAIRGNRIVQVGDNEALLQGRDPRTRTVDLQGAWCCRA